MTCVSGWQCRPYVQSRKLFRNNARQGMGPSKSSLWSEQRGDLYVVFSYRYIWPIYVNWKGVWFANEDKFSRTTTKHQGQAHPLKPVLYLSRHILLDIIQNGEPVPEVLVMAAQAKLLSDDLMIEATKVRIAA